MINIVVIDGQGGRMGSVFIERWKKKRENSIQSDCCRDK